MFSHPKASSLVVSTLKNWLRGFWNTLPTRVARRVMGSTDGSTPSTSARPHRSPRRIAGSAPFSRRVTVVLPQPERPHNTTTSPAGTSSSRSSSA